MTDSQWDVFSNLGDAHKFYFFPEHMMESPQLAEGQCWRLGGSMVWASAMRVEAYSDGKRVARAFVTYDQWGDFLETLPEKHRQYAIQTVKNITKIHSPLILGERTIALDQPRIMGIVNMTPDSFSDGGIYSSELEQALDHAAKMLEDGAAILDIGGESTRPGAPLIWEGDEIKRVTPIIEKLAAGGAALSIDSRKSAVMKAALDAGAHIINDISALLYDDDALQLVCETGCPVILMHASSQSSNPHKDGGQYGDVVTEIYDWLGARVAACVAAGVAQEKIFVDPGLGFGKTLADNLALVNALPLFHGLGCPIVFGASRKRMIGALSKEAEADKRLGGSIMLAVAAMQAGAQIIRVHDVYDMVQAVNVWRGLRDAALTHF